MTLTRFRPHSSGVCLALILFLSGCEKLEEQQATKQATKQLTFPITRTITDSAGRSMEATLIGRDATSITLIRKSDDSRFTIPLSRLAPADQDYVQGLPLLPPPVASSAKPPGTKNTLALNFLKPKRDEISKDISDIDEILLSTEENSVKARSLRSERERLLNQLSKLDADIRKEESK